MATISSFLTSNVLSKPNPSFKSQQLASKSSIHLPKPSTLLHCNVFSGLSISHIFSNPKRDLKLSAVAEETAVGTAEAAARRLYVGNIPRNVGNEELKKIFEEHGAVEKAEVMYDKYSKRSRRFAFVTMKTEEDTNAAIEKMNGTEIGGRPIKVNVTEKPLTTVDTSILQSDESQFVDSPYKVYVGNLAKTVTSDMLAKFFSGKGKVLSAKISRVPGTSKSSGFGFVSFSSDEDVETAISSLNNSLLEGQKIRVNKA